MGLYLPQKPKRTSSKVASGGLPSRKRAEASDSGGRSLGPPAGPETSPLFSSAMRFFWNANGVSVRRVRRSKSDADPADDAALPKDG